MARVIVFVRRMFPPATHVPVSAAIFLAPYLAMQAIERPGPLRVTWRAAAGTLTVVLFAFLLRVYDELKDFEADRRLARQGDPRYRDRPLVTGEVSIDDVRALRWWITAALFALNLPLGWPFAAFLAVFGVTWLSLHWFFWPAISRNLLLALATHGPLELFFAAYAIVIHRADFGGGGGERFAAAAAVAVWAPVIVWETSRKIRLPRDETDYPTYSKVLGWRVAALIPALTCTLAAVDVGVLARAAHVGWPFVAAVTTSALLVVAASLRLLLFPTSARADLRPHAEVFAVAVNVGLPIALVVERWP